jgi:hypothetical protein
MSNAFTQHNAAERKHLQAVIARLAEADYARPVGDKGWTVASALAHLAYYDKRASLLTARYRKEGVADSPSDLHILNDALAWLFARVPGSAISRITLEAAEEIDRMIDELPADLLAAMQGKDSSVRLDRGLHRASHLGQIEKALGWS